MTNSKETTGGLDSRVARLKTPQECESFSVNARAKGREDLVLQARRQAVNLLAKTHGANSEAETEALQAVYAYEAGLSLKNGKNTRASRTWQMIKRYGIIESVERAVNRPTETQGYLLLAKMGLEEYAFEAVILRHPEIFSDDAVKVSKARMAENLKN